MDNGSILVTVVHTMTSTISMCTDQMAISLQVFTITMDKILNKYVNIKNNKVAINV